MSSRARVLVALTCSGAAGLTYELVWARHAARVIGHADGAIAIVMALVLAGLAVGAAVTARLAQAWPVPRAQRAYAVAELGIATTALLAPLLMSLGTPLLMATYNEGHGGAAFAAARLAVVIAALGIPSFLMGATFPLSVRVADGALTSARVIYAVNTLGAALGAGMTAFVAVPQLGLRGTTIAAAGLNILAAALVVRAPVTAPVTPPTGMSAPPRSTRGRPAAEAHPAPPEFGLLAVVVVSGAITLAYEVLVTRLIALAIGPTTYAFGAALVLFIVGLGAGALMPSIPWIARQPVRALGAALAAGALAAGWLAHQPAALFLRVADIVGGAESFSRVFVRETLLLGSIVLPLAIAGGMVLPLALARFDQLPARVAPASRAYAWSTIGSILGSLLAGFVLIPWLGLSRALQVAGACGALVALAWAVVAVKGTRWRIALGLAAAAALAATLTARPPDPRLLSSGAYKYASDRAGLDQQALLEAGTLLFNREAEAGTVTVRRTAGITSLAIDGKADASDGADMLTQRLLAHAPLLTHGRPRTAAVIGLGSGVTASAALAHDIESLDVIELSPAVVDASGHFRHVHRQSLEDPRLNLIVGDGRTHLALTRRRYDVIVSEPSNPWMAGIASLYTQEFFRLVRDRLTDGGVFCQWAHTYDIDEADVQSIVATLRTVFPHASAWVVGGGDLLLLGSLVPLDGGLAALATRPTAPRVRDDLASVHASRPLALTSLIAADTRGLDAFAAGAGRQTDDRARLEFTAPLGLYAVGRDHGATIRAAGDRAGRPAWLDELERQATAADLVARSRMLLAAGATLRAAADATRALALAPDLDDAVERLIDAAAALERPDDAVRVLRDTIAAAPAAVAPRAGLARLLAATGDVAAALAAIEPAVTTSPDDPRGWETLASIFADAGDGERLAVTVDALTARFGDARPLTAYYRGTLAFLSGDPATAAVEAGRALARQPTLARAAILLGAAEASRGNRVAAATAFREAIRLDPTDVAPYVNLGRLALESDDRAAARSHFSEALLIAPGDAVAREALASLR
ncbi:MAG: fused MFS/spermidine synthase [Acidobacteria bacterium]|nr:fused MFS/spermidine synthase [Acidobacteriota bacterium]